jgi:hypothetical protein
VWQTAQSPAHAKPRSGFGTPNLDDPPVLISTRTLELAPWSDREFYTGGYDGAANNRKNHNTAWIFKGVWEATKGPNR